jgi:membrane protein involved in colicin uptake
MGFMNIFNNVSMQATGNLEVLVDRMLQTEGNPNSMQGMYNPSQFIHEAYNRNIDQKLHANRSEINIKKQELRHANDGKEGKEKIQKQIEELENKVKQEENGKNAEREKVEKNSKQEEIGDKENKRRVVNDEKKDKKAEDEKNS